MISPGSGVSQGNQLKYRKGNQWIKIDSIGIKESVSEVLVSELQYYIVNPKPFVDYSFFTESEKGYGDGCISDHFLKEGESCISVYSLLKDYNLPVIDGGEYLKNSLVGLFNMEFGIDLEGYLSYMVYLDAITLNTDRHLRNICVICRNGIPDRPAPIFDNGLSLCSYEYDLNKDLNQLIGSRKYQPFSNDWRLQVSMFDNPHISIRYSDFLENMKYAYKNALSLSNETRYLYLRRAIKLLVLRLEQTKGVLWVEI